MEECGLSSIGLMADIAIPKVLYFQTVLLCGYYCESTGTHGIAMVEAIIGNINHLRKSANLDYSGGFPI